MFIWFSFKPLSFPTVGAQNDEIQERRQEGGPYRLKWVPASFAGADS